jgi:MerR family transcriptional regulator, light-induced transcriptional regulator
MGKYSIKEIEQLSGIKAHTIRIWEQRYNLLEPKRTETNIRYYDDEQLKFILNVSLLSKNGHKISRISKLSQSQFHDEIKKLYERTLLKDTELTVELGANDLMTAMIDMDESKFNQIYDGSIRKLGFEKTITHVIYPFLAKVGIFWAIDQVNPAQEHFMSCLIRQKIMVAIDRLDQPRHGKRFLLFLPHGEHHELGLLMAHYLLKEKGARVYYLGQNVPTADIPKAIETVNPDFVLTFIVDPALTNNANSLIANLAALCQNKSLLIAINPIVDVEQIKMANVQLLHQMEDLEAYIA